MATELLTNARRILGQRVRNIRVGQGMTQDDFCQCCGIANTYLSTIEMGQGNSTLTMLAAIADTLGCKICELFVEDPDLLTMLKEHVGAS